MQVSKKLIENVKELKKALNEISVYDLDVYTSMELYYKIAKKLNEVINELSRFEGVVSDEVIEQNKKLLYLLGEGLKEQVAIKIHELHKDGTLDSIINQEIFSHKVDKTNLELYAHNSSETGDTILLKTNKGKVIVIDTGSASDTSGVDTFIANHTSTIDYLIITHYHSDHIGNFEYVLNKYKNDNTVVILPCDPHYDQFMLNGARFEIASNNVKSFLSDIGITPIIPTEQQIIQVDDIKLKFMNCSTSMFTNYYDKVSEYAKQNETDYNNFSLVVEVTHGVNKILLTSDINVTAQEQLEPYLSNYDILKAPHHSVDSKVSQGFLKKVSPRYVFSCSKNNSSVYKAEITRYLLSRGIPYYVTYQSGEIKMISNGISVKTHNKEYNTSMTIDRLINTFNVDNTIYYGFGEVTKEYDNNTNLPLETIIRRMKKGSICVCNFVDGKGCTPSFLTNHGGHGLVVKSSDSKAYILVFDGNSKVNNSSIGVWLENSTKDAIVQWYGITDKVKYDKFVIGQKMLTFTTYAQFKPYGDLMSDSDMSSITTTSTGIEIVKALPPNSSYHGFVTTAFDPSLLDQFGGVVEIIKASNDKVARLKLTSANPSNIAEWVGIYHSDIDNNAITWKRVSLI